MSEAGTRGDERADVIAWLEQRRDAAEVMATRSPEFADVARERARQLRVMIDEVRAGMHVGAALVRADLLAVQDERKEGA